MNVKIGAEAALFPEKEYIKGIFVAVHCLHTCVTSVTSVAGAWSSSALRCAGASSSLLGGKK
jgi:hypothetical protein